MGSCRVAADTPTAVGKFTIEKIPSAASRQPPRDKSLRLSKMTLTFIVLLLNLPCFGLPSLPLYYMN